MPGAVIPDFIYRHTFSCHCSYSSIKARSYFKSSAKPYLIFVFKFGCMDVYENAVLAGVDKTSDDFD